MRQNILHKIIFVLYLSRSERLERSIEDSKTKRKQLKKSTQISLIKTNKFSVDAGGKSLRKEEVQNTSDNASFKLLAKPDSQLTQNVKETLSRYAIDYSDVKLHFPASKTSEEHT